MTAVPLEYNYSTDGHWQCACAFLRLQASLLLTSIAIADCITMSSYLPYALHFYVFTSPSNAQHSFACIVYLIARANLEIFMHTLSMYAYARPPVLCTSTRTRTFSLSLSVHFSAPS